MALQQVGAKILCLITLGLSLQINLLPVVSALQVWFESDSFSSTLYFLYKNIDKFSS